MRYFEQVQGLEQHRVGHRQSAVYKVLNETLAHEQQRGCVLRTEVIDHLL